MLEEKECKILGRELRRADSAFKDFLYVTNFASLYHYSDKKWNKLNIEGTFVLYDRSDSPWIGIHVFNRKALKDFSFGIRQETRVGINDSLMTLQNEEEDGIYGLWFHSQTHPQKILDCLRMTM